MKHLFKIATLATTLALATNMANATDNIAYVNPAFLMQNHPIFTNPDSEFVKSAKEEQAKFAGEEKKLADEEKKLAEDAKKLKAEEKAVSESMKQKVAALEKDAPRLRSAEIKKRQDAINAEGKAFQKKVEAIQKREQTFRKNVEAFQVKFGGIQRKLAEKQAEMQQGIVNEVEKAIADTAKAKGYTLVLDATAVLFTQNEANDITADVYKALGGDMSKLEVQKPEEKEKDTNSAVGTESGNKTEDVKPAAK